ncbi:hypothetical protein NEPAR06_0251 [Nematocida parisii]|uniref:RRM domain-containing protein n=1 Tax=Nematocida parisii (strain ERTm3) TaxID=935791 RepID=I3EJ16_NEMP3|nr:uncharacterized protein NEPG_01579 [Nematocida parisii ERTm1]EIJ89213.1 hypothetical protein NEQG_01032 [Nematocida parisii ERTm3]KAI5126414.1 hypothetical protein NEPAR03_0495 [Nematocida parisii]EIJ93237.1 hypothetical protein NEPG_01579 [Nematocida parisii ERTm1]KAI5126493.1 hypothetical protein NEPAR08_0484 [Nematocida parisii]KAI5140682.1 hypothetical protein NEPAR04_0417 [Nematocida parisii]|eukprot:XP_013059407.1 hypothetical protein NEPG_01579 [Nematocida parisii ERTm1]
MRGVLKVHNITFRQIKRNLIEMAFERYGKIKKITMPTRRDNYALVEYATEEEAVKAKEALDGTTLCSIHRRTKATKNSLREFVWNISILTEDFLWEKDASENTTEIEREIVKQKKKNLFYVEAVGEKITHTENVRQRPIIQEIEKSKDQ